MGSQIHKKIVLFLTILLFFITLTSKFVTTAYASHKVFTEDFNSDEEGLFPNGWLLKNEQDQRPCSANWHVHDGMAGIVINQGGCSTNIMPSDELWNSIGDNYVFEFDMKFVTGTDHNIAFRFTPVDPKNKWYEIHFQSPGDFILDRLSPGFYKTFIPGKYPNGNTYHVKIIVNINNIKVYINNVLIRDYLSFNDPFPSGRIALRAGSGSDPISETYFDNIVVTSIDGTILDVPLLKQTSDPWQSMAYDTANLWSNEPNIYHWGSALTSAAMVFQYNGIKKLPNGTTLDPGTMNTWLNTQEDGYIGKGYLNWLALTRLSKLAKASGNNPNFTHDALEYRRIGGANTQQLNDDIEAERPDILEEPGHFIVGRGKTQGTFAINDPFHNRYFLNDGYDNAFLSLGRYIPSDTDLSYIMLVVDENIAISTKDSNGISVGEQFFQQPLKKNGGLEEIAGPGKKIYYLPQPTTGTFNINLSGDTTQTYTLQSYLYDVNGDVTVSSQSGVLSPGKPDFFVADFNKQSQANSKLEKLVTFQSTQDDITEFEEIGLINKQTTGNLLEKFVSHAEEDTQRGKNELAIKKLNIFVSFLEKNRGGNIAEDAYQILLNGANYLINSLQ